MAAGQISMETQVAEAMMTAIVGEGLAERVDRSDPLLLLQPRGQAVKASFQVVGVDLLDMVEVVHAKDHPRRGKDCPLDRRAEGVLVDRAYLVGQGA